MITAMEEIYVILTTMDLDALSDPLQYFRSSPFTARSSRSIDSALYYLRHGQTSSCFDSVPAGLIDFPSPPDKSNPPGTMPLLHTNAGFSKSIEKAQRTDVTAWDQTPGIDILQDLG